jgi:glycine cleavage system H protein
MYPAEYRYTKEHEWIDVKDGIGTVGITDYAQHELGDVVFVEMPKPGTKLQAGEPLGTVESVKAVSEIYAPVGGEIVAVNDALGDSPELLNQDPQGKAWLIRVKISNPAELAALMDAAAYQAYITEKEKEASA